LASGWATAAGCAARTPRPGPPATSGCWNHIAGSPEAAGQLAGSLSRFGGPGVQRLAFLVDDIDSAVRDCSAQGIDFLPTPSAYYDRLASRLPARRGQIAELRATSVLADRDEWGYLLQLFTRSPYPRNTVFYELVQRRRACGFGGANIKALYEAVARADIAAE
jgi:4-hydroxymandelate synthase